MNNSVYNLRPSTRIHRVYENTPDLIETDSDDSDYFDSESESESESVSETEDEVDMMQDLELYEESSE